MDQALLVFTSLPDEASARDMATQLVNAGLAACINIQAPMRSVYIWENVLEVANEVSLHIKTSQSRYASLEQAIVQAHPYDVPEIIAVPIVEGLPAYLDWVRQPTKKDPYV